MTVFPTTYAQVKAAIKAGAIPVCIDRFPPLNYYGARYNTLAPWSFMMTPNTTAGIFKIEYQKLLSKLNREGVINQLRQLSGSKHIALFATNVEEGKDFVAMACEWLEQGGVEIGSWEGVEVRDNQTSMF